MGVRPALAMPAAVHGAPAPGTLQASRLRMFAACAALRSPIGTCRKPRPGDVLLNQVVDTQFQELKRPKSRMPWARSLSVGEKPVVNRRADHPLAVSLGTLPHTGSALLVPVLLVKHR